MRITDSFRIRTVTENLNSSRERMTDIQEQLSTAKRINRPSDDPEAMANVLKLRTILETNHQFQRNIEDGLRILTAQETAMNDAYEILMQVKELAIEGASDSITVRESLADQLQMMLNNLVEIANTKENGKYLFGGTETMDKPFQMNENVVKFNLEGEVIDYYGNKKTFERQINENTRVTINLTGAEVFDQSDKGGSNLFQTIYDLKLDLLNDDSAAISAKIEDINDAVEQTLKNFLKIGTRKQLIVFNQDRFSTQNIQVQSSMSYLEDTDFGEAFIQFKAEENALNSALSAGARVISPSLLDFLGAV